VGFLLSSLQVFGQRERDERAMITNFKGLQFKAADSSFYINFRFRMQNRLGASTISVTNLNFNSLSDANLEFLSNIQYNETTNSFSLYSLTSSIVKTFNLPLQTPLTTYSSL
jgi:hypothetical protein